MVMHPSAWVAWLTAVGVFAFVVTNPLYILLGLGAVIAVHLSYPPEHSAVGRAVRLFLVVGLVLLLVRLVFIGFVPNPGETALFRVPSIQTPTWLGGLDLGGEISAEVLVAGFSEGLRLILVLVAFGVFNARADLAALLRSIPPAFRDIGLVVSIAVAFVPGMLRTVGDVRDAQRLRGEQGLRRLAPSLAVPVLGMSLERALLLAESMDVRGYGRGGSSSGSRGYMVPGLVLLVASVAAWVAGTTSLATLSVAAGAMLVLIGFRAAYSAAPTTRLATRPATSFDIVVIVACAGVCAGAWLAGPDAVYNPYPVIVRPPFQVSTAALTLLLATPGVGGAAMR